MLEIALDLNVTYSVLRFLISFREVPWYGLVYYLWDITTTSQSKSATSILLTIYKVTVSYQYMCASFYREIHLLRFINKYCTLIYNKYVIWLCFVINHHKNSAYITNLESISLWYFVTQLFTWYIYDLPKCGFFDKKQTLKYGSKSWVRRSLWGRSWVWFKWSVFRSIMQ